MSAEPEKIEQPEPAKNLDKLDLGCGKNKQPGYSGVDVEPFDGVDFICNLTDTPWSLFDAAQAKEKGIDKAQFFSIPDGSVSEVHCSHFIEHLSGEERIPFMNELYRVLKPGGVARIIAPDWSHDSAYGDPTHKFPPMSRWSSHYWSKEWRSNNSPHCGYTCDFDVVVSGAWDDWLNVRAFEMKQFATMYYTNSLRHIVYTITKK